MPTRRQLRRKELQSKPLFPWVSVHWTSLEEEQKREKERKKRCTKNAQSATYSILKGICTLYGTSPGSYCKICKAVHQPVSKDIEIVYNNVNADEEDDGEFLNAIQAKKKNNRIKCKQHLRTVLKKNQINRMKYAANALKRRRRARERKMKVPQDSFLQDFTDTGGSTVTKAMNDAIDESFHNYNFSRKESRFKGRIKTTGGMLKFPKITNHVSDVSDDLKELQRREALLERKYRKKRWKTMEKKLSLAEQFAEKNRGRKGRRKKTISDDDEGNPDVNESGNNFLFIACRTLFQKKNKQVKF
jgi:hypothetical protein